MASVEAARAMVRELAARAANMPLLPDLPSLDVTIKVAAQQTTPPPVARPSR